MSGDLTDKVEDAIREWFEDSIKNHPREGKGDVVIDWVVGFTVSNIVEVEDDDDESKADVVGYANWLITPLGNPNAHIGLARWVVDEIGTVLPH